MNRRYFKGCADTLFKDSLFVVFLHRDGDLLNLANSEVGGSAERSDDGLRMETLLHIRLQLLQELSGEKGDGCGTVSNLEEDSAETEKLNFIQL